MSSSRMRIFAVVGVLAVAAVGFGAYRLTDAAAKDAKAPAKPAATAPADTAAKTDKLGPLWGKSCDKGADGKQSCVIVQNVVITNKSDNSSVRALAVAVGYLPGDTKLHMALTIPLGINLPTGLGFQIDDAQANTVPIDTCVADGCHIMMAIDQGGRDSLIKSKLIKVSYQLVNGQKVTLPIELTGFGDALAQLPATP